MDILNVLIPLMLLIVGYSTGKFLERAHYSKIRQRERKLRFLPIIASRWQDTIESDEIGYLFDGSVVVSSDYFKVLRLPFASFSWRKNA